MFTYSLTTFFVLVLILAGTLYPYDFVFNEIWTRSDQYFIILEWTPSSNLDVLINILLFLPLGFSLTGYVVQKNKSAGLRILAIVFLISFGLSCFIEVLQVFETSRHSSWSDVFSNSIGALFGFICFCLWKYEYTQFGLLVYVIAAFLLSIPLQAMTSLDNWDKTFPILFGNERIDKRPWSGHVSKVYIGDKAISEKEAERAFSHNGVFASMGDSLLATYHFKALGSYLDDAELQPHVLWRGEVPELQQEEGVVLGRHHWLETSTPATDLTQRIMQTSQFTLGIRVETYDPLQTGPARIVSLSADSQRRNFTLGQWEHALVFRLRTPLTGENGLNPALLVPGVFSTGNPTNLVITYDGADLLVYINGVRSPYALELTPGAALFSYFFHASHWSTCLNFSSSAWFQRVQKIYCQEWCVSFFRSLSCPNLHMRIYKILYYAIIFIPLGVLLSYRFKNLKTQSLIKVFVKSSAIFFPAIILEFILVSVSARGIKLENFVFGMIFTACPIALLMLLSRHTPATTTMVVDTPYVWEESMREQRGREINKSHNVPLT